MVEETHIGVLDSLVKRPLPKSLQYYLLSKFMLPIRTEVVTSWLTRSCREVKNFIRAFRTMSFFTAFSDLLHVYCLAPRNSLMKLNVSGSIRQ